MILCLGTTPAVQRVMVFGKLTLDAVNRAAVNIDGPSGKSVNVAKVLKALGAHPIATGFLGGDRGEFVKLALTDRGVESEFVPVAARTRQCITVIDQSTATHTELVEESSPVTAADFDALLAVASRHISRCRAMVMSGTIAPGGSPDLYFHLTRIARQAGALAVVDAQGKALAGALAAQPDLVKPNRAELAATVGRALSDEAEVKSAMRELQSKGARMVVVTAGGEAVLAFDGREFWRVEPPKVAVANPIGSGDAFTAGLVFRLVGGDNLGEACRWGAAAGAANALTLMPGELNREDVERLLGETRLTKVAD